MLAFSVIMFLVSVVFAGMGIAIYRGKTDLIHNYHQTKVTDKSAYGKAFGKAMFALAAALLLSGIVGLLDHASVLAIVVLLTGLCVGVGCILAVQRKYNKGVF